LKALVWEAPRVMMMRDQPEPGPQQGEVVVKVAYVGICGSELGGYLGHNALRVPPLVMGHEFAGEIAALGERAQQTNPALAEGQPVTVNPLAYCGTCEFCRRRLNQLCTARKLIGAHRPGAYAEYVTAPAEMVSPLPDGMSLRVGALTEPVACGVRIGELAGRVDGEICLVVGAGPIGLLALQILHRQGAARVFIAERDPERLAMGTVLGGEPLDARSVDPVKAVREVTGGLGAVVSVDAVGTALTRQQCIAATRSTGTVILSGLHEESSAMPAADIIRREIVVRGSFAYTPANFAEALRLLSDGAMKLDPWIVEAPLAEGGKWFDRLIDAPGDVAKVLLVP
jgi:threonine dehydrogenase-like Zn-dependent dehydrogenase